MQKNNKELTLTNLVILNITAVFSLSSIAYMSTIGLQSVLFFAVAAITFFIPSALIVAELGGIFTKNNGGVFTWVKSAFGDNTGLIAIWMEWFNNVISFPGTLLTILATVGYYFFPELLSNKTTLTIVTLSIFWLLTLFNFLQLKKIIILYNIGATLGMIISAAILIMGGSYKIVINHQDMQLHEFSTWFPAVVSLSTFALFVKTLGSYSGIQAIACHTRNILQPQKTIPKSIAISVLIIFGLSTLATVSLVSLIPTNQISPLNGMIQGLSIVLNNWHIGSLIPYMSILIATGMLASLSAWLLGPARSMQEVAHQGMLPKMFAKTNKHNMPVVILITQAIIVSILIIFSMSLPNLYQAFAMILALTSQFTVVLWIMIFASAIKLRFSGKHLERHFKLGNSFVLCTTAIIGIISCFIGFCLGFIPPKFAHATDILSYSWHIAIVDSIVIVIPFLYIAYKKKFTLL